MSHDMNAREQLEAAFNWLGYQHEDLSFGLKSPEDALKLWKAWVADSTLPEFCDQPEDTIEERKITRLVVKTIGYDPWKRALTVS